MKEHETHHTDKQTYWEEQDSLFKKIQKRGGMGPYMRSLKNPFEFLKPPQKSVSCIDERTPHGGLHYAGAGILDQEHAISLMKGYQPKVVYSHEGCGAAAMAFAKLSSEEQQTYGSANEYAKWWAGHVAKEIGASAEHLPVSPEFHVARVTYYDGTGRFNPRQAIKAGILPPGFIVSRHYLEKKYAMEELELSLKIAFGDHGFGKERFNEKAPYTVVVIGDQADRSFGPSSLAKEVHQALGPFAQAVSIESFGV